MRRLTFKPLPPSAAWRHDGARDGFESVFIRSQRSGHLIEGHTAVVEEGQAWVVRYVIAVDNQWSTRIAQVWGWSTTGEHKVLLEADGSGEWRVNGSLALDLDGCLDVDLESSALTNTLPVHRLELRIGERSEAPAAYVRALDLRVERLDQQYERVEKADAGHSYEYRSQAFDFEARLDFDDSGLVLTYPGIATRVL